MIPFDHLPRTRLVFGPRSVERVGALTAELGGQRVLLVTDPGLVRAGHADRVKQLLEDAGLEVTVFDAAEQNPTTRCVERCVAVAREAKTQTLVGLGGGSSMDTAKGCNFLLTNGGRMQDYWGVGKATKPMLPFVAVPTTAGTGSECQSAALIADADTHQKMACLDPKAAARVAILDPELTLSQPPRVTAQTGVDALAHAIETAVTRSRSSLSLMYSHEAFKLLVVGFTRVLAAPEDLEARGRTLLGAALAGTAIENSMLGGAHSAANPLTARYDIPHGEAVGLMLPAIIRFNTAEPWVRHAYAELASAPEIACVSEGLDTAVEALLARVEYLLNAAGLPRSLADRGVAPDQFRELAEEAGRQWTAQFNPRPLTVDDFVRLYEMAFSRRGDGAPG
jgi:alcohol dehydrogenase